MALAVTKARQVHQAIKELEETLVILANQAQMDILAKKASQA
jgi:hypothetical protein